MKTKQKHHQYTSSPWIGLQSEFQQQFQAHILRGDLEPGFRATVLTNKIIEANEYVHSY